MEEKRSLILWRIVDDVAIGCGMEGKVTDETWNSWVAALATPTVTKVLNIGYGSIGVTSVQRMKASEVIKNRGLTVAVVTDVAVMRGMVTAVSWFVGSKIKSFSLGQIEEAIAFLGSSHNEKLILQRLDELKRELGIPAGK